MFTKKIFLILFMSSIVWASFGQLVDRVQGLPEYLRNTEVVNPAKDNGLNINDIKGSAYDNEQFQKGYLLATTGTQYEGIPLRFNAYNNNVEYKTENGNEFALANPEMFSKVKIGEDYYFYRSYKDGEHTHKGFLQMLVAGEASLYKKSIIAFREAKKTLPYQDPIPPSFIKMKDQFFIEVNQEVPVRIVSKKDLLALFDTKELLTYIRKNKIKATKREDLIKFVEYYNSL